MAVDSRFINEKLIDQIEQGEGLKKEAEVNVTSFIRDKLREESFTRQIITPQLISADQLDRDAYTDKPKKVIDKEPNSKATWVSFRGTPKSNYFTGPRYEIYFAKITSDKFEKSIHELKTYDNDIRQILSDNSIKDIQEQEDASFINSCEQIVQNAGPSQLLDFRNAGGLIKENFLESRKALRVLRIPHGVSLMSQATAEDILKWNANEIGDGAATVQYEKGLVQRTIFGGKVIYTIKNDIIPDGTIWHFGTEQFLGKFFFLQDATVYIKHERDMISFDVYEVLGMGIGNTKAVVKAIFFDP
jgi:hypothetical protein